MYKIDLFLPSLKLGQEFDAFELQPVKKVGEVAEGSEAWEVCEEDDAEMWSVYIHVPGEGLQCIADCETKESAEKLYDLLILLCDKYDNDYKK